MPTTISLPHVPTVSRPVISDVIVAFGFAIVPSVLMAAAIALAEAEPSTAVSFR